jgi:hypothetical protein
MPPALTLLSQAAELKLNSNGCLLIIGESQVVTIENVRLEGRNNNNRSLVSNSGVLHMNSGEIYGNTSTSSGSGVSAGGTFFMTGGKIHGNKTSGNGGGVSIAPNSNFRMTGGEITGNTAASGGGVSYYSYTSDFFMNGGTIYGNEATNGGGVHVLGIFRMYGGIIAGSNAVEPLTPNTASSGAALYVYVSNNSSVTYGPNNTNLPNREENTIHVENGVLLP